MSRTSHPGLQVDGPRDGREVARVVNGVLAGRLNVIVEFDVAAGQTLVVVEDARLAPDAVTLAPVGSTVIGLTVLEDGRASVSVAAGADRVETLVVIS